MEREIKSKFGETATVDFSRLRAADIQGRSRAFGSLVTANMDVAQASRLVGFSDGSP